MYQPPDEAAANSIMDKDAQAATSSSAPSATSLDQVPIDALAMPDDSEKMEPPSVGDMVNYSVSGKVTKIEGGIAYVERETINGQDVDGDAGNESAEGQPDGDEAALQADAAKMGSL